uniref:IucA/IucC family protein n=1 Tax=Streptomyces gossypii TaxID=2883101 RepID=UPI0035CD3039
MNARSGSEGYPSDWGLPVRKRPARRTEPTVPRQPLRSAPGQGNASLGQGHVGPDGGYSGSDGVLPSTDGSYQGADGTVVLTARPDPLEAADTGAVADAAAVENLLRCWVRENDLPPPEDGALRIPLTATGTTLCVPLRHWSATGWHRFGPPLLDGAPLDAEPVDAVTLAALIGREAAHRGGGNRASGEGTALVGRVADSVRRTAVFLAERRVAPGSPRDGDLFLDAEQALLLGHPVHPTPKSREGLSDREAQVFSPEMRGSFALHWLAVDASVLATDSAWHEHEAGQAPEAGGTVGAGGAERTSRTAESAVPAGVLAASLAGEAVAERLPDGAVLLPLHPWQARELRYEPRVVRMLEAGLLHDLGQCGDRWHPTSSVRTVHRPGATAMLKLSLGLRITNSRRENLRKELLRGVEVHRLLRGGLGARWQSAHPGFDIVRDPAWLGVDLDGEPLPGLDTVIRHNPFAPQDDAVCVASLASLRPWPGAPGRELRSRLSDVVRRLACGSGEPVAAVAAEWFRRYLDTVVRPVLWLDAHAGIALEAHQQNTLVLLDPDGWPCGGRYRDNQGYYFRTSRRAEIERQLPGAGVASDSYVDDDVTDERFAYYLGINNVLGLIGAFGSQGLADERLLLSALRGFLDGASRGSGQEPVSPLPALLLDSPTLRCKANLLTRLRGMDELVGPVDTQSVYVTVTNPLSS